MVRYPGTGSQYFTTSFSEKWFSLNLRTEQMKIMALQKFAKFAKHSVYGLNHWQKRELTFNILLKEHSGLGEGGSFKSGFEPIFLLISFVFSIVLVSSTITLIVVESTQPRATWEESVCLAYTSQVTVHWRKSRQELKPGRNLEARAGLTYYLKLASHGLFSLLSYGTQVCQSMGPSPPITKKMPYILHKIKALSSASIFLKLKSPLLRWF